MLGVARLGSCIPGARSQSPSLPERNELTENADAHGIEHGSSRVGLDISLASSARAQMVRPC